MSSLILNGDTSGSVTLAVPTVAGTNTVTLPAVTGNVSVMPTGYTLGAGDTSGFKNRIINGDMRIDQRNAGSAVTPAASGPAYTLDRWSYYNSQVSKLTYQQNAGSVTPPTGFTNYLGVTTASAYSVLSGDVFVINQPIEGLNVADLGWGTADAKTVTLSFWVRSSLTGTFGGSLRNTNNSRSYSFAYTISSANTWTQISVTIAGDTTGTWLTTNGTGISVTFCLGAGSTFVGTENTWSAGNYTTVTGATSVIGTSGATFYITGVQLEVGSQATSFDFRDYGRELIMCQRYYEKSFPIGTAPAVANYGAACKANHSGGNGAITDAYSTYGFSFKVTKRATPTMVLYSSSSTGQIGYWRNTGAVVNGASGTVAVNDTFFSVGGNYVGSGSTADVRSIQFDYTASAEL